MHLPWSPVLGTNQLLELTIKQQEIAYIEQDPNSAPHPVENRSPPEPPFLYLPEHNDKYPVQSQGNNLTGPVVYDIPSQPQLPGNEEGSAAVKRDRKWPWIVTALFAVVVALIVIIVPSIVATRA